MYNAPLGYEISNFSPGWDNMAKATTMEKGSFREMKNFNISRHGGIEKRGGMVKLYGDSPSGHESGNITSLYEYNAPDGNAYLLTALGTKIRAFYEAAWHDLKTGLTVDKKYSFATHLGLCYGVNGVDPNFKLYNDTPYQVGLTPPADAPTIVKLAPGSDSKIEEYADTNQDNCGELLQHADRTQIAQGFKLDNSVEVAKVKISLKKIGTITAGKKVWVEIHSNKTGTQEGGDSDLQEANDIGTPFEDIEFTFSGTKPDLDKNTPYYLVLYGDYDVSSTNFIVFGFDNSASSYVDGKYWEIDGTPTWTDYPSIDLVFEIYGTITSGIELISHGTVDPGYSDPIRAHEIIAYLMAQSFVIDENSMMTSVKLALEKNAVLAAKNYWVEIHDSRNGTSETKNTSTRQLGDASDEINGSNIPYDPSWVKFTFSGEKPSLPRVETTVDQMSSEGTKVLHVTATTGFIVGGSVVIGRGTEREEIKVIESIQSGASLTLTEDLDYTHIVAQADVVENTYYIVLYCSGNPNVTKYLSWMSTWTGDGYSGGQEHWISNTMVWSDQQNDHDYCFKVYGYATGGTKVKEYALDNIDIGRSLRETSAQTIMAQSFQITEEGQTSKVKLWLAKKGVPTGNIWVEIHDGKNGTDIDKDESQRIVGEASDNVNIASISAFPDFGIDRVTDTTIAFVSATKKITDSNNGLAGFLTGDKIRVTGSVSNDGTYTVATGGVAGEIVVEEDLTNEDAGASITIEKIWVTFTFSGVKPTLVKDTTYYLVVYASCGISTDDYISVGEDKIDPSYSSGKRWDIDNVLDWTEKDYIDLIFEIYAITGGLIGRFKHKYCYKRTMFKDLFSNPSEASSLTEPESQDMRVSLIASLDPQVNKIILYRTKDMPESEDDPLYHKVVELPNEDQDYVDTLADGSLTTLLSEDNTIPPRAKFVTVHKDRVFYANLSDPEGEENWSTKVMWSKSGVGEACPSLNYQYFDRDAGEEIMGIVSLRDYLLVFKRDKIGVLSGDLSQPLSCEITYLSLGIGCIASWAILPLENKVLFLSEEGWKATDGVEIYSISSKINRLIEEGYITINQNENYSVAYYPEKEQFQFLMNHSELDPIIAVGHFIIPLMLASKGIIGISEKALGAMVGWTPHQYESHTLVCLGNYTDDNGITKVVAGSDDGHVYLLDSGSSDDGVDIRCKLRTDWLSLGRPKAHTKVTRRGRLIYSTDGTISLELQEDVDYTPGGDPTIFTGAGRGIDDTLSEPFHLAGRGEFHRYTLTEISSQELIINAIELQFRDLGAR